MSHLVPCIECARHVRRTEAVCPFCGIDLPRSHAPAEARSVGRMGRAALFAFGTSVAAPGCGDSTEPGGDAAADIQADVDDADAANVALYGAVPAPDADDANAIDAADDADAANVALYGAVPAPDADDATQSGDDGGAVPLYGAVPSPEEPA